MTSPREEAARAYHDALVGVARRHIDRAPEHSVDPWLLEELITLADVARRLAEGGEGFDALSARLSARRAALPSLDTLHPPALVRLFASSAGTRARSEGASAPHGGSQLQRLHQACDAIVERPKRGTKAPPRCSTRACRACVRCARSSRVTSTPREARERITRAALSTLLREACAPLEREATLMRASATLSRGTPRCATLA